MRDTYLNNLKELMAEDTFMAIMKKSIKNLKPSKTRIVLISIIIILMLYPIITCVYGDSTVQQAIQLVDLSNDVIKDLLAINFTGYALFQALAGASTLRQMLTNNLENKSVFKNYNLYFFGINILYISIIFANFILKSFLSMSNFNIINSIIDSRVKFIIWISFFIIYIVINLFAIIEIKSFIVNMYHCFNISAFAECMNDISNNIKENDNTY